MSAEGDEAVDEVAPAATASDHGRDPNKVAHDKDEAVDLDTSSLDKDEEKERILQALRGVVDSVKASEESGEAALVEAEGHSDGVSAAADTTEKAAEADDPVEAEADTGGKSNAVDKAGKAADADDRVEAEGDSDGGRAAADTTEEAAHADDQVQAEGDSDGGSDAADTTEKAADADDPVEAEGDSDNGSATVDATEKATDAVDPVDGGSGAADEAGKGVDVDDPTQMNGVADDEESAVHVDGEEDIADPHTMERGEDSRNGDDGEDASDERMAERAEESRDVKLRWSQTPASVQFSIPLPEEVRAKDVVVDVCNDSLFVGLKGKQTILHGDLCGRVSNTDLTWQIESDGAERLLSVELDKDSEAAWPSLLAHEEDGTKASKGNGDGKTTSPSASPREFHGNEDVDAPAKQSNLPEGATAQDSDNEAREQADAANDTFEDIIELNTDDMRRGARHKRPLFGSHRRDARDKGTDDDGELSDDNGDDDDAEDNLLADDFMEALEQELQKELSSLHEEDSAAMGSEAPPGNGEAQLMELLAYYKSVAQGKTVGRESVGEAAMQVALFYSRGIVVEQDFAEAARWYEIAAEQGSELGMFHLGLLYQEGRGRKEDLRKAVHWWQKAADLGHANSMYNLGVMTLNGHGAPQDFDKAVNLFNKAHQLDSSLPFPPFVDSSGSAAAGGVGKKAAGKPTRDLTPEERALAREESIQTLRYIFWTTTALAAVGCTAVAIRYWWKNRL